MNGANGHADDGCALTAVSTSTASSTEAPISVATATPTYNGQTSGKVSGSADGTDAAPTERSETRRTVVPRAVRGGAARPAGGTDSALAFEFEDDLGAGRVSDEAARKLAAEPRSAGRNGEPISRSTAMLRKPGSRAKRRLFRSRLAAEFDGCGEEEEDNDEPSGDADAHDRTKRRSGGPGVRRRPDAEPTANTGRGREKPNLLRPHVSDRPSPAWHAVSAGHAKRLGAEPDGGDRLGDMRATIASFSGASAPMTDSAVVGTAVS